MTCHVKKLLEQEERKDCMILHGNFTNHIPKSIFFQHCFNIDLMYCSEIKLDATIEQEWSKFQEGLLNVRNDKEKMTIRVRHEPSLMVLDQHITK